MVRIDQRTNIFNLIENRSSTVEHFKRLREIAPAKFELKNYYGMTVLEFAIEYPRDDLVPYLRSILNPSLTDKIIELLDKPKKKLEEFLEDKDLKTLTNDEQITTIDALYNIDEDIRDTYNKLIMLLDKGIDVNTHLANSFIPDKFNYDISLFKNIIKKYNFDVNKKNVNDHSILYRSIIIPISNKYEIVKFLLEKGANVNEITGGLGYLAYIYRNIAADDKDKYYKLFLENGINPDQPLQLNHSYTLLIMIIHNKKKEIFDLLLEKGADPNVSVPPKNITPLAIAVSVNDIYYVRKLIEKGADVNQNINSPLQPLLLSAIAGKSSIDIIKLLLDSGANKESKYKARIGKEINALDYTLELYHTNKEYYREVIELLGGKIPEEKMWKGFSKSDISKFDLFFEETNNWSCCPVCLAYVERSGGCMYMNHDCANTGHYYHKELYTTFAYEKYEGSSKKVEWCTICGRITNEHRHFKLSQAKEPSKEKEPVKPDIEAQLARGDNDAFYDNANCVGFGGGAVEEKAARFRRLREYALELQEDVNKKPEDEVMKELIEEVWNAPLVRNRKIKKILADKKWNINVNAFPEDKPKPSDNNNSNAANVPFEGRKPTVVDKKCAVLYGEHEDTNTRETNPIYHFHHETVGGINHEGIYICQKDLARAVEIKNADFGLEDFGKCWWYHECKGILHPEELKEIIPEVLYIDYKKKFNKKMVKKGGKTRKLKKQKGGDSVKSMLHELTDGTCTPHNWTRDGKLRK